MRVSDSVGIRKKRLPISKNTAFPLNRHARPFSILLFAPLDATAEDELRDTVLGLTEDWTLLFVVYVVTKRGIIRIISARRATRVEWGIYEDNQ
jgi:uncharacterized DUF497 family protein